MITRIVLADDHKIVRQGLKYLLESEKDLQVIAEASNGGEAAIIVEREQPAVLVADLRMPGLSGIELTKVVVKKSPKTITIILSMFSDEVYVTEALRAGAKGYVVKDSSVEELVFAIREALEGKVFVSQGAMTKAIQLMIKNKIKV